MKKRIIFISILILILLFIICFIAILQTKNNNIESNDQLKFKTEYEDLNIIKKDDNTNKYISINIPSDNKIKYLSFNEVVDVIKNQTGIIYLGFPECPWCRRVLPVFFETCQNYNIDNIYYYNALDIRDKKHLDENGEIVTDKEGTTEYYLLVDLLKEHLTPYDGLNDENIKRIYFPTFVFVKDGKILGTQISSVSSYTSTKEEMTEVQKEELKSIFDNFLNQMYEKIENCNDETTAC